MKLSKFLTLGLMAIAISTGCGSKGDEATATPEPAPIVQNPTVFGTPTAFTVVARDNGAQIHFLLNNAAAGYRLYFGNTTALSGLGSTFQASPIVTTSNNITVGNLTNGTTYYFAVSAVDASGTESVKTAPIAVVPVEATAE